MAGDASGRSDAGSADSYLPPVFTQWTGDRPAAASSDDAAAPPFLPESGEPVGQESGASAEPPAPSATPASVEPVEFPADAFIMPDDVVDAGVQGSTADAPLSLTLPPDPTRPGATPRAMLLADRLEALALRLRSEGAAALGTSLAVGDRFDALLSGLLAGYLAAGDE